MRNDANLFMVTSMDSFILL